MARHLLIGSEVAVSYTSGILLDGSIDVQKKHAGGATAAIMSLVVGETVADADMIRIVQGDSTGTGVNIVSPWFYGRDVINWSGKSYAVPVSQSSTLTWSADATNTSAVEVTIKLVNTSNGQADPFDAKSYTVSTVTTAINLQAEIGDNFTEALYADYDLATSGSLTATQSDQLPWFVKSVAWDSSTIITLFVFLCASNENTNIIIRYSFIFDNSVVIV